MSYLLPYAFTFCHDSFLRIGAMPYMSQLFFVTIHFATYHTPQRYSPLRLILSLSPFHIPPLSDCIDYVILLRSSPYSTPLARHSSTHDPHSLTSTSVSRLSVHRLVCGRWASAERRQSSLTVRPIHQQWCIDLHLRVFTLRKNYWSPASPPQTVCERLVSTFSFHLSLQSYGSNPISEPLFGLT